MSGFLDNFRQKVITSVWKETPPEFTQPDVDDKIALGVLLWAVAEADEKFLPQEGDKIIEVLSKTGHLQPKELEVVLQSVQKAAEQRIDLHRFTKEISQNLDYQVRVSIIEDLFRVACSDKDLADSELEVIRKISGLFHLVHRDFIDAKIKIKRESGLRTV